MWTKICGIRSVESGLQACAAGASAIGLNFFAGSPRVVPIHLAAAIVEAVGGQVDTVGVFVNHSSSELLKTSAQVGFSFVQLHGDEPPELIAELRQRRPEIGIIRAFRMGPRGLSPLCELMASCRRLSALPNAFLVDAYVEGTYGGTGRTVAWDHVVREYDFDSWPPLILAGGLRPENVADAIRTVNPWGVDVAGGVESESGTSDPGLVAEFVKAARQAAGR